jgi:hypothetical protein
MHEYSVVDLSSSTVSGEPIDKSIAIDASTLDVALTAILASLVPPIL